MTLEEKLHDLTKRGELVYFSVASIDGKYRACFSPASPLGEQSFATDTDPVRALMDALSAPIKKRAKPPKNQRGDEAVDTGSVETPPDADEEVTAKVKPERSGKLRSYM